MIIAIEEIPLNTHDENLLKAWLNKAEAYKFQAFLDCKATILAAQAANSLVAGSDADIVEAKNSAEDARIYERLSAVISEARSSENHFSTVKLQPKPIT